MIFRERYWHVLMQQTAPEVCEHALGEQTTTLRKSCRAETALPER